MHCCCCSH